MKEFISNPNQRDITINKLDTSDYNITPYSKYRLDALKLAMSTLTPKAFIMWVYLGMNKNGYKLYLSRSDFIKKTKLSSSSYDRAIKELKDLCYLVPKYSNTEEEQNTHFDFYELPQKQSEVIEIDIHKEEIRKDFAF